MRPTTTLYLPISHIYEPYFNPKTNAIPTTQSPYFFTLTMDAFPESPHICFRNTILSTESIFIIPLSLHTFSSSYTHVQRPSPLSIKTCRSTGMNYLSPSFFVRYFPMICNPEYFLDSLLTLTFLIPGFLDFPTFSSAHDKSPFLSDYSKPFSRPLATTDFAESSNRLTYSSTTAHTLREPPPVGKKPRHCHLTLSSGLATHMLSTKVIICENGMLRQCKPTLYYESTSLNSLQSDLAVINPLEPHHTFSPSLVSHINISYHA